MKRKLNKLEDDPAQCRANVAKFRAVTYMAEDFKLFLEDLFTYLNCQEAGITQLRMQINKLLGESKPAEPPKDRTKLPYDVSKIYWQDRENEKGKFQVSEDYDNIEHKNLLKFLGEHAGGCIQSKDREGRNWFYWIYTSGSKIGRRLKAKTVSR